ncbi:MAG: hypothetical protein DI535_00215 [Citrobacter freundii]|nr:MAG: hypothetical protein DI535_00215 [Citrobacter freundii]
MKKFLLFSIAFVCSLTGFSQTTYTWNGSASSNWSTASNWSPAGVPSATDNIVIVTGSNPCRLNANASVNNMTLTSGTVDPAGFVLTVNGPNATYTAGTIQPGKLLIAGANSVSFGNGPLVFNCKTDITSASFIVRNTRFEDSVRLYKTGAANDGNYGNNIFNAPLEVTNAGTGSLLFGTTMADQFNASSIFNVTGTGSLYVAYSASGHVFNGPVTFNSQSSSNAYIYVAHNSTSVTFNSDIFVNSTSGAGVLFCNGSSAARVNLAAGSSIKIGSAGFSTGLLWLRQLTKTGSTAQNLLFTGDAGLRIGPDVVMDGDFTSESPVLLLNGGTFNGATSFRKVGPTGDWSNGGNVFNGVCSITNSGGSFVVLGNNSPDIWNDDVTFTANGADRLLPAWRGAGHRFNGNIYVNSVDTARGIQFCGGDTSARAILAAGKTIMPGALGITSGYLYLKQFIQLGSQPVNITATANGSVYLGPNSEFSAPVTVTAPNLYVQGARYHAPASFVKTGGGNNSNNSNPNIFESTCTIEQQSNSGYFMLGYRSDDQFLDDIVVNSSGTAGIYIGSNTVGGWPSLAAGRTIKVGSNGFSSGFLWLKRFTQNGTTPIQLNFTGSTAYLAFSDTTTIGGDLITNTPGIYFNGGTFKNKVTSVKIGGTNDQSTGGNIFLGETTLINSGTGVMQLGGSRPDSFYAVTNLQSDGTSYVAVAWNTPDNYFGDDVTVASSSTSRGIYIANNTNSYITMKAGHTIRVGNYGYTGGTLTIRRFRQLGNQDVDLPLTGTANLTIGPLCSIGGNVTASSPSILLNGAEYLGSVAFTKTGPANDGSDGGNIFQSTAYFNNAGSGYFLFGDRYPDTCRADVTFTSSGSERILPAWSKPGNMYYGDIYVNSTGSSTGVRFCGGNTSASATLAAGRTIAVGSDGFNSGNLQLRQFTKLGNAPVNLTLSNTASYIQYGPSSVFNGDITSVSPGLYFNGATFNGKVNCTKNGSNSDYSTGNNVFNDSAIITSSGPNAIVMASNYPDIFNAAAVFNNTGTANMHIAQSSTGNIFRGVTTFNNSPANNSGIYVSNNSIGTSFENDIIVTSPTGAGVQFCNNGSANATLSSGRSISIGAAGFGSGTLLLRQFTQTGTATQNINMSGGTLSLGPSSSFGGPIMATSGGILLNSTTFASPVTFTKTGISSDNCVGGNQFQSTASFTVTGTGYLALAYTNGDTHTGDVTFIQTGTGKLYPNYNATSDYAGNVSISSPSSAAIVFGGNAGTANFNGSGSQSISVTAGSAVPVIARMIMNNTGSGVTLNSNVNISKTLTFNSGLLHTSAAAILTMLNNSTTAVGSALSASYVSGPMRFQKQASGLTTLNFPIGDNTDSRPLALTVNHTNGNLYTYQAEMIKASAKALNYTLPFSVQKVSEVRYYTVNRYNSSMVNTPSTDLSGNQSIEIFFGSNDAVTDGSKTTIVKNVYNAPTSWIDIGGSGAPAFAGGANLTGSIRSTSSPSSFTSFSTFALGNIVGGMNTLPVTLMDFKAVPENNAVSLSWITASENNNSHFNIERSTDAVSFKTLSQIASKAPGGNSNTALTYSTIDPLPLNGVSYYRLKQTDLNGKSSWSKVVKVDRSQKTAMDIYPNPARNTIYLSGFGQSQQNASVEWWDIAGRNVLKNSVGIAAGYGLVNVNLPGGIYLVKVTLGDGTVFTKQILIRP